MLVNDERKAEHGCSRLCEHDEPISSSESDLQVVPTFDLGVKLAAALVGRRLVREPRRAVPGVRGVLQGDAGGDGGALGAAGAGAGLRRRHRGRHLRPHPHGDLQAAPAGEYRSRSAAAIA